MRIMTAAVLATAIVVSAGPAIATAAPKDYCADLKGVNTGQNCQIQLDDPAYTVDISFPSSYPDTKSIADYVSQTRDAFLNVAKSSTPRDLPYALRHHRDHLRLARCRRAGQRPWCCRPTRTPAARTPETSFKSFNWDQTYRKPITYDTLWQADANPLPIICPIVAGRRAEAARTAGHHRRRARAWTRRTTRTSRSPTTG